MATTTEDCLKSYERRIYIHVYVYVYTQRGQSGEMGAGELAGTPVGSVRRLHELWVPFQLFMILFVKSIEYSILKILLADFQNY